MTYLIEYLGEFEFIFETIFDYESGTKWVLLMQKNRRRKSHAWAPLSNCYKQLHYSMLCCQKYGKTILLDYICYDNNAGWDEN